MLNLKIYIVHKAWAGSQVLSQKKFSSESKGLNRERPKSMHFVVLTKHCLEPNRLLSIESNISQVNMTFCIQTAQFCMKINWPFCLFDLQWNGLHWKGLDWTCIETTCKSIGLCANLRILSFLQMADKKSSCLFAICLSDNQVFILLVFAVDWRDLKMWLDRLIKWLDQFMGAAF